MDDGHASLEQTPGLLCAWDFAEPAGTARVPFAGRQRPRLIEVNGRVAREEGAPLGGHAVDFADGAYLAVPAADLGDLDRAACGSDQVSLFALMKITRPGRGGTIAGVWYEGLGPGDDSGTRQYALLLDMNLYGGAERVTPHVSSEGGATRRADGTAFPWCVDFAATAEAYPTGRWCSAAMTYDGVTLTAFLDGVATPRLAEPVADNRDDPYFTRGAPGGRERGVNPYHHGRGLFRYDADRHANEKPHGRGDFVVGARCVCGEHGAEALAGQLAGLAVFGRCLAPEEVARLHHACLGRQG